MKSALGVYRRLFLLVSLLSLAAIDASSAQAPARQEGADTTRLKRSGTWSAANSAGRTFIGTWTGTPDSTGLAVTGTWALLDAQGNTVINGGWSAAKAPTKWNGAWRARVVGRTEEYSGTWTSSVDLKGDALFAEFLEKAVASIVSGTWRAGPQSGAWSIRAAKRAGSP